MRNEKEMLRGPTEVTFRVKHSQEQMYAVLPRSQKLVIIYQLLCNISKYSPVDRPRKHQTRRSESSSNTAVRTPNTTLPQQLPEDEQELANGNLGQC
jgi:hypothetical protein